MKKISIILLNYNTIEFTKQCINSLSSSADLYDNYEIIVVDNNSKDKILIPQLKIDFPKVKIVLSDRNLGFGGGNNLGVKSAEGEYLVILNNDTVVYPNTISEIIKILEVSYSKTIITGFIEDSDGGLQYSGGKEPTILFELMRFGISLIKYIPFKFYKNYYFYPDKRTSITNIPWATGCFFAMTTDFYKKLDGFDENMFMYFEDVEFHKRVRLEGGRIDFRPELKIKHYGGQSSKNVHSIVLKSQFRNTVYYFKKHKSTLAGISFYLISKSIFLFWYVFFGTITLIKSNGYSKFKEKQKMYRILLLA